MADSTVSDIGKMKVIELRKELRSRGLPCTGDKSELVTRLQNAVSQDDTGDINLDSDEIDSDGVLEEDDDKSQPEVLDDSAVDTINEELALADNPTQEKSEKVEKPPKTLKRKITMSDDLKDGAEPKTNENKDSSAKKIILHRTLSTSTKVEDPKSEENIKPSDECENVQASNKVKITSDMDNKTRLEMRAKRFGLPIKTSDDDKKEARKMRFGQNTSVSSISNGSNGSLTENLDKLKKRADRFGQSVSKIMTEIEKKEILEKRKAKFQTEK